IDEACAVDDFDAFTSRVGTGRVFGGQQPYVDYYPAVLAKLDAVERAGGFYAFADYAPLGSDPWLARTELPSVAARDGILRFPFQPSLRVHAGKDLRFVPPPSKETLCALEEKLKATITCTAKVVPLDRKSAFDRLRVLLHDYEEARTSSRSAGEFNTRWSTRIFRRLGYQLPLVSLSDLLENHLPSIAETLEIFIANRVLVAESVAEALAIDVDRETHFTVKDRDHVPLAIADENGFRRPVRLSEIGNAEQFLRDHAGRWSLDVFAPIFLFRLGLGGIINGRGSIRYSLVLAHVMRRVFGENHVPNLLCSCSPVANGPFAEAVRKKHGALPDALREPTLIARLLESDEATIRREIAESW
ncbi:MAG TPA: hypothetical protein VMU84_13485, partial [Thermoanaerobaculia bacterium]|nr:hypothetical protein [Thermoanaerobaculia bacterium]